MSVSKQEKRVSWVDQVKGLGIVLVVLGHTFKADVSLVLLHKCAEFIFLFHMPLFFILSGYLYQSSDPLQFIKRRFLTLGLPYLSFLSLMLVYTLYSHMSLDFKSMIMHITPYFYGGAFLSGKAGILWFLTCLFLLQISYNFVFVKSNAKHPLSVRVIGYVIGCVLFGYIWMYVMRPSKLPIALEVVPMATVLFWFGHCLAYNNFLMIKRALYSSVIGSVVAITCFYFLSDFLAFDMKFSDYGIPFISLFFAASLSVFVIRMLIVLSNIDIWKSIMSSLGRASLVIMCLHQAIRIPIQTHNVNLLLTVLVSIGVPYIAFLLLQKIKIARVCFLGEGSSSFKRGC